jgi:double-stranded uracil-DNA glycosylase
MPSKTGQWDTKYGFVTLPDHLRAGLELVFIGINPGLYSVAKRHYFARSTSRFWPAFSASRLSEKMRGGLRVERLRPEHDSELLRFGFGVTDVVKKPSANASELTPEDFAYWAPQLLNKVIHFAPRVACFHGLTAYRPFLKFALHQPKAAPALGPQPETIGGVRIFVAPNPSPANAHFTPADQTAWYDRLADFLIAP